MKKNIKKYGFITGIVIMALISAAATIDLLQPEANLITDSNGYIRFTSQAYSSNGTSSNLNSAAVFKSAVNSTKNSLNMSFTDGLVLNGALTGITNVTATGTIQGEQLTSTDDATITDTLTVGTVTASATVTGEQLTSTDDATITDDLGVGGNLTVTGTLGVTDDITATDDFTIGGWLTIPATLVAAQSYTISSTGKASGYRVNYSDTDVYDITLPTTPADGTILYICDGDLNAGTNNGTIYPGGADTIQETTSFVQNANGECEWLSYNTAETDWGIVAGYLE